MLYSNEETCLVIEDISGVALLKKDRFSAVQVVFKNGQALEIPTFDDLVSERVISEITQRMQEHHKEI